MNITLFLIVIVLMILVSAFISFWALTKRRKKDGKPAPTFNEWFYGNNRTWKAIGIGMISGTIFGFIDNAGLFLGMSVLDPILAKLPYGNEDNVQDFTGKWMYFSDYGKQEQFRSVVLLYCSTTSLWLRL